MYETITLILSMLERARTHRWRACQKEFTSPIPKKLQDVLLDIYNMPPEEDRWDDAVYACGQIMNHYLENCPSGDSWLSARPGGKLYNIVTKRNKNIILD